MSRTVSIDELANAINEGLEEYADLSAQGVKSAVRKSAKAVKEQINGSGSIAVPDGTTGTVTVTCSAAGNKHTYPVTFQ